MELAEIKEAFKEELDSICQNHANLFEEFVQQIYDKGYADGVASCKVETTEEKDLAAEQEADTAQADNIQNPPPQTAADPVMADPPTNESPEKTDGGTFDPKAFVHAKTGTPETVCGIVIDHSIEVVSLDDPNAGKVNCPKCLDILKKLALAN